jgi:hypothetical protein
MLLVHGSAEDLRQQHLPSDRTRTRYQHRPLPRPPSTPSSRNPRLLPCLPLPSSSPPLLPSSSARSARVPSTLAYSNRRPSPSSRSPPSSLLPPRRPPTRSLACLPLSRISGALSSLRREQGRLLPWHRQEPGITLPISRVRVYFVSLCARLYHGH